MSATRALKSNASPGTLTVHNPNGLQALPATDFVNCVLSFKSAVTIHSEGKQYPADRIVEVLLADLKGGDTFVLEAEGPTRGAPSTELGDCQCLCPRNRCRRGLSFAGKRSIEWDCRYLITSKIGAGLQGQKALVFAGLRQVSGML